MKLLIKHTLNYEPTWEYVKDNLDQVNALSILSLKLIDFKEGNFFTLLPEDGNIKWLYNFQGGGILPPNPVQEHILDGKKTFYRVGVSIMEDLSTLIFKKIMQKKEYSLVLDDVSGPLNEACVTYFSDIHPVGYEEDLYFMIDSNHLSQELILKSLRQSMFCFWHSLGVLTTADLTHVRDIFDIKTIEEICLKTDLVMVGAYDSEGYVFWERDNSNFFE